MEKKETFFWNLLLEIGMVEQMKAPYLAEIRRVNKEQDKEIDVATAEIRSKHIMPKIEEFIGM